MSAVLEPLVRCDFPGCRRRAQARPDDRVSTASQLRSRLRKYGWRSFHRSGWTTHDYCPDHADKENLR